MYKVGGRMKLTSLMGAWLTKSIKPFAFESKYHNTLSFAQERDLGLYVHIPFCRSLCHFCPYCKVLYKKELAKDYLKGLLQEIDLVGNKRQGKKIVTSLYFGGGSPALFALDLKIIIDQLEKYFIITEGIGVELHPEDVTLETLLLLKKAGVTMISIGVQSFSAACTKVLGRKPIDAEKLFRILQKVSFDTVDMDLIFAIPGQTGELLKQDIKKAFDNGATQISTYPFIDFTFADNKYKPLSEKEKKNMLREITQFCKENGYVRTSVWTFAKEGTKKYSSVTRDSFLGFGVSATTLLKKEFKINTFSIEGYLSRVQKGKLPTSLTLQFSMRQRMVYFLFWHSYAMEIREEDFLHMFGKSLQKMYPMEMYICCLFGLLKKTKSRYYLTEKGAYYYHYIEQVYTTAYIDKMWSISRNEAFPKEIVLK